MKQIPFPAWWRNADIWRDRHHAHYDTLVDRPTEDAALRNVYYQARLLSGDYRIVLNDVERRVDEIDTMLTRAGKHYTTPNRRYEAIIAALPSRWQHMTAWECGGIMQDIELVRRNYAMLEDIIEQADAHDTAFRELVREVMLEDMQRRAA